jgi:phosphoribosylaminoimidazole-succinocarboxamide synthase
VRDYLLSVPGWNKQPPAPDLPPDIIEKTAHKYREAYRRLTGATCRRTRGAGSGKLGRQTS